MQIGSASSCSSARATFVGNFIGSPGMNFLAARGNGAAIGSPGGRWPHCIALRARLSPSRHPPNTCAWPGPDDPRRAAGPRETGQDLAPTGWSPHVGGDAQPTTLRARLDRANSPIPRVGDDAWFEVVGEHSCYYRRGS